MFIFLIWIVCTVIALVLVASRKLDAEYFILSLFLGPLALAIILLSNPSLKSNKKDFILSELSQLRERVRRLERIIDQQEIIKEKGINLDQQPKKQTTAIFPQVETSSLAKQSSVPINEEIFVKNQEEAKSKEASSDIEKSLGQFWLNKVGIVILTLGVGYLISYSFKWFGPWLKIAFGELLGAALIFLGSKFELKEKFKNYGLALIGGGWAVVYFTTYAAHHFEASRIIDQQWLAVLILFGVTCAMIKHSLKYKSETMSAVALFVAYITTTLGDINYFTFISSVMLAVVTVVIVYRMQWVRILFLGIALTYITHAFWVVEHIHETWIPFKTGFINDHQFVLDLAFLFTYWALFTFSLNVIRSLRERLDVQKLNAANYLNFLFFSLMGYNTIHGYMPEFDFIFVFGLGMFYLVLALWKETFKKPELAESDFVIAFSAITLAVPIEFLKFTTDILWFIEIPFLLYMGIVFERRIFRYLSVILTGILFLKVFFSDFFLTFYHCDKTLMMVGFLSMAACYYLLKCKAKNKDFIELQAVNIYSLAGIIYLIAFNWAVFSYQWLTLCFSFEALGIYLLSRKFFDKYLSYYALLLFGYVGMLTFFDARIFVNGSNKYLICVVQTAIFYVVYLLTQRQKTKSGFQVHQFGQETAYFGLFILALLFNIDHFVPNLWKTSVFLTSIILLLSSYLIAPDHKLKFGAIIFVLLFAYHFSFLDQHKYNLVHIAESFKWILIGIQLLVFYSVYLAHTMPRFQQLIGVEDKFLGQGYFVVFLGLILTAVYNYMPEMWVTLSIGVISVILFVFGFIFKDKVSRYGGFLYLAITIARLVFVEMSNLEVIYKIISFIVLGVLFLAVSFIYNKYYLEKTEK